MIIKDNDRISQQIWGYQYSGTELNSQMLIEDLHEHIVPYVYSSRETKATWSLAPNSKQAEKLVIRLLNHFSQFAQQDMGNSLWDAVRYIADGLANDGLIVLELVTNTDQDDNQYFTLVKVPGPVSIKNDSVIQNVPQDMADERNIPTEVTIPRNKCFLIYFPESLGGMKSYQKWLDKFRNIGNSDPFNNFLEGGLRKYSEYDSVKHHKVHELALWSMSKDLGWNHRGSINKLFSGYYSVYRSLRFRRTQFIFRDYIIAELIKIVNSILNKYELDSTVQLTGLMQINEIEAALNELKIGKLKIDKIGEYLFYK